MKKTKQLFFFSILGALLTLSGAIANIDLPEIGDSSRNALTPTQARLIGDKLIRYLNHKQKIETDPLIQDYINSLGNTLVSSSDEAGESFRFFIIRDNTINAFAAPGKVIGIHSGLLAITRTESELAAVVAHEIAHVTQHHLARFFEARRRHNLISTVAVLAAMLVGDKELRKAAIAGSAAGSMQAAINFTRGNEKEADSIGIQLLTSAGFNPHAMPRFFQRMQDESGNYGTLMPEFLRTHPISGNRIADATNRINISKKVKEKSSINFHLMKVRMQVLNTRAHSRLITNYKRQLKSGYVQNRLAAKYGLILTYIKTGKYNAAKQLLAPMLLQDPARLAYIIADADIALARKQLKQVKAIYDTALDFFPKSPSIVHYYANALLELGQAKSARQIFQNYLSSDQENKLDAEMHNLYALAAARSGYLGEAYQHKAEFHYLNGNTDAAIAQLIKASRIKNNNEFLAAEIAARLNQLKSENKPTKAAQPSSN